MNQTRLFDAPAVRRSDPPTARFAAASVKPGNDSLIASIRWFVSDQREPVSAFDVSAALAGSRWSDATVRTAVSRAQLTVVDEEGLSPRGQRVRRYAL